MNQAAPTIMWFRDDLRLRDNAALEWAAARGPISAVIIDEHPARALGGAARWWWEHSVAKLEAALAEFEIALHYRTGDPEQILPELATELGAAAVTWNRRYHKPLRDLDARLKTALREHGLEVHSHAGFLLTEPWEVATATDTPYKVFTPFSRAAFPIAQDHVDHLGAAEITNLSGTGAVSEVPVPQTPHWAQGFVESWTPGEAGAHRRLAQFVEKPTGYAQGRDQIARTATSRLSPHLRFGEISVHRLWSEVGALENSTDTTTFRTELLWRDFAWHRLYELPTMGTENVREKFDRFGWAWDKAEHERLISGKNPLLPTSEDAFHCDQAAWRAGRTGIPLIDAGMRELWHTGTMHNRVRMVVASFLTKNLLTHWRHGEEWFWETLVDADLAANAFNWQWAAGSGDDAAPYFRIFNPETQAKKFDPDEEYVRRWIPEIGTEEYPAPIVDLKQSRQEALDAYAAIK